jgi:hypothetical protein
VSHPSSPTFGDNNNRERTKYKNSLKFVMFNAMKISRDVTYVSFLTFVTLNMILLAYVTNIDRTIAASETTHTQLKSISNSTDQMARLQSLISNQSDDIKAIRNSTAAEVQLFKSITQGSAKTSTQIMFTTLSVFFLGVTLIIYGLKLTLRAPKQTSRYLKVVMWALITPVIALIAIYQIGTLLGTSIEIYKADEPFFFISVLLLIPVAIIIFLLIAERKLMQHLEHP